MAKKVTVKKTKVVRRKGTLPLLRGDMEGPCSQLDQRVTSLEGQLSGFLTLIASPPPVASYPVLGAGGWVWEPL